MKLVCLYSSTNSCFIISLFYSSTCFEHYVLFIKRSKLYYTASDIITPVGGRPVRWLRENSSLNCAPDGHLRCVTIPDAVQCNFDLLMMSTAMLGTCRGI